MDWIRCSERLPEFPGKYTEDMPVTTIDVDDERRVTTAYYCAMNGKWYSAYSDRELGGVVAWCDPIEPFNGSV